MLLGGIEISATAADAAITVCTVVHGNLSIVGLIGV